MVINPEPLSRKPTKLVNRPFTMFGWGWSGRPASAMGEA